FLMGFGFPTGMRLVSAIDPGPTPWFWGINGAAGVLAASLAVVASIAFSIDVTLAIGAACYLLVAAPAALLVFARAQSHRSDPGTRGPPRLGVAPPGRVGRWPAQARSPTRMRPSRPGPPPMQLLPPRLKGSHQALS